jgi:prophage maintenance system killer protein
MHPFSDADKGTAAKACPLYLLFGGMPEGMP